MLMKSVYSFIFILMFMIFFSENCTSAKKVFVRTGNNQDDAIQIAILDFSRTPKLFKKDSVFFVYVARLKNYNEILIVSVGNNISKLLVTKEAQIGSKGKLPSRYIEKQGKLFYWWDANYPLTEEALSVFKKFNLLQDDINGRIQLPEIRYDEAEKNADYYFCKNDPSVFKKIVTNRGIGYYDPPLLKCSVKN
jgi:hypothetical protein